MAVEHLFVPADEPPDQPDSSNDGTNYTLGWLVRFAVDGQVTGMRAFGSTTNSPDAVRLKLFRVSDQALLGFVDLSTPWTASVWNSANFASAVNVLSGVDYYCTYYVSGVDGLGGFGHTVYDEGFTTDRVNGNVTGAGNSGALKSGSALNDYPDNFGAIASLLFWVDVNFVASEPHVVDVGTASEQDHADVIGEVKQVTVGIASEQDHAAAIGEVKQVSVGQASEQDHAAGIAAVTQVTVGIASEQDHAAAVGAVKIVSVGQASEQDHAAGIAAVTQVTVGTASEQDHAAAVGAVTQVTVGIASEQDHAGDVPPSGVHIVAVGTASEQDHAAGIGAQKQGSVDTASEQDHAAGIAAVTQVAVGIASEQDHAGDIPPSGVHVVTVGTASEQDHADAVPPLSAHVVDVGTASETDYALPILVKPVPGQPALAQLIWAVARLLRDCLCTKLLETVGGPVCRCSLMAGDSAIADICEMTATGDGQAWVRMTRLFVTDQFPRPIADTFNCAGGLWAAEFELGVLRCGVTSDAQGQPPGADELNAEVAKVMDDAYALRITAECCIPSSLPSIPGEWTPMSGGACTGGKVTVMVYLVPGPYDLIPQIPANVMP